MINEALNNNGIHHPAGISSSPSKYASGGNRPQSNFATKNNNFQ
jgi:hypothetical protein